MLKKLVKNIDRELARFIREEPSLKEIKKHSPALYSGIKDFALRGGKRIRPLLFILGYLGYKKGPGASERSVIKASLSQELLHDFLLIHDDIIDNSLLRRGKPTLHVLYNRLTGEKKDAKLGADLALVAGDIIFTVAIDNLLAFPEKPERKEKALKIFARGAFHTGIGEFLDVINNKKPLKQTSRKEVLATYTLKTAKYTFEGPLAAGAALAGAGERELEKLSGIGLRAGQAFQVLDDLLDVFSTEKNTGKSSFSDLAEKKKTMLVFQAHKALSPAGKKVFEGLFEKKSKTRRDLERLKEITVSAGAKNYCVNTAERLLTSARKYHAELKMKEKHKTALLAILESLYSSLNIF